MAVGAASADGLLLWPSSALYDGHNREEEEAHRGDGDPDEVVLVPMLVPVLRYGSAGLALRALARDARPVMHSHVMPGCVFCRPAAGRCLALALLERPVQPASRGTNLDLPVRLRAGRQEHKSAARRSKASQEATHRTGAACLKSDCNPDANSSLLEYNSSYSACEAANNSPLCISPPRRAMVDAAEEKAASSVGDQLGCAVIIGAGGGNVAPAPAPSGPGNVSPTGPPSNPKPAPTVPGNGKDDSGPSSAQDAGSGAPASAEAKPPRKYRRRQWDPEAEAPPAATEAATSSTAAALFPAGVPASAEAGAPASTEAWIPSAMFPTKPEDRDDARDEHRRQHDGHDERRYDERGGDRRDRGDRDRGDSERRYHEWRESERDYDERRRRRSRSPSPRLCSPTHRDPSRREDRTEWWRCPANPSPNPNPNR